MFTDIEKMLDDQDALVEVRGLSLKYTRPILRDINVKIPAGQTLVVLGESGCGKTQFLKSIIGLVKPTRGTVLFNDQNIGDLNDRHDRWRSGIVNNSDDFRTPLSRVRGLGSAKEGTEHFWRQRLTAIANVPLIFAFAFILITLNGASYERTIEYMSSPFVSIILLMILGAGIYHMKLGMQVIIEDYVHGGAGKLLLIANTFFCITLAAACGFAVLKLGFGD